MLPEFLIPVKETCLANLLDTKWLLAPSRRVGNQWKDQINLAGINSVNLQVHTVHSLVMHFVEPEFAERNLAYASPFITTQLLASIVNDELEKESLTYFSSVSSIEQLALLLNRSIQDLRLADVKTLSDHFSAIESSSKAADLQIIIQRYEEQLEEKNLVDYSGCCARANELLSENFAALPNDSILISPIELELSHLESKFLEALKSCCNSHRFSDVKQNLNESDPRFQPRFQSTIGEVNEVRTVFQQLFVSLPGTSLDQNEVLHTDYSAYVPLIFEQLTEHLGISSNEFEKLPVTFAEGLACIYSRPGRALRSWLRWIRADYLQDSIVRIIREGLLSFEPDGDVAIGFSRLSHLLRELPIGFGSDRYQAILVDAISDAKNKIEVRDSLNDRADAEEYSQGYDFGLEPLERLSKVLGSLVELSPSVGDEPISILDAAETFLTQHARYVNSVDSFAKAKLLDDINAMKIAIAETSGIAIDVWKWLEDLPVQSRILASGPQPGCIHVDSVHNGGHSGRSNTFILGLDDSRFPKRGGQDPLLLDFERQRISQHLETAGQKNIRLGDSFNELLTRLRGTVTFSFATQALSADRGLHPSSLLLELFRRISDNTEATIDDFIDHVGVPESFCNLGHGQIHHSQWWQSKLAAEPDVDSKAEVLEEGFVHFGHGRFASEQRLSEDFTQYDGCVPEAGLALDPTDPSAKRTSSSRLETFGTCPRKFFFRYGLGIYPPDEHEVDSEQWLDALQLGSLIHEVFEDFLRELTTRGQVPDLDRDLDELLALLHRKTVVLQQTIPVPNQDAYERQIQRLEKTCEIFLRNEEQHCRDTGSAPWILEASIGLGDKPVSQIDSTEPVSLTLKDGRSIKVGGRIDRVDRIGGIGSMNFSIWDYKSGSAWGFDPGDPFREGRKLQPFLYAGMLRHRLIPTVGNEAKVNYFGYFFPSPKTEGLRLSWTTGQLKSGDAVLCYICDAISAGAFLATNNADDCKFCDYLPICGSPAETAASSLVRLENCHDSSLDSMRALRSVTLDEPPF